MIVDAPGPVLRRGDEFRGIILRNDAVHHARRKDEIFELHVLWMRRTIIKQ